MKKNEITKTTYGVWILNDSRFGGAPVRWEAYELGLTKVQAERYIATERVRHPDETFAIVKTVDTRLRERGTNKAKDR